MQTDKDFKRGQKFRERTCVSKSEEDLYMSVFSLHY